MKKIIFMLAAICMAAAVFAMSKPKEEVFMEEPASEGTETLTGYPVYLGNAPFEQLALKVSQKDNSPAVYYIVEFEKDSKVTEKEIAALQGQKIQISGKIEKSDGSNMNKIFCTEFKTMQAAEGASF